MSRYKSRKYYEWSPSTAYIAGLIASDGCLVNDKRHINITSKDIDQLENFRNLLNLNTPIKQKNNGYGGVSSYIQFSDVALYDFLFNAGITPAKSKILKSITVPDSYYRDFLRGYFDGDGSVYGFWDTRWKNSLMYYTEFSSASIEFLIWLQIKNVHLALTTSGNIKSSTRVSILSYAKSDSKKIFEFIYYAPNLPTLTRKYNKFVDFLKADPYANKKLDARVVESVDTQP